MQEPSELFSHVIEHIQLIEDCIEEFVKEISYPLEKYFVNIQTQKKGLHFRFKEMNYKPLRVWRVHPIQCYHIYTYLIHVQR